jgi:hypothetical protein
LIATAYESKANSKSDIPFASAVEPSRIEGTAINAIPENPTSTASIRRGLGTLRTQIAVITVTTTGRPPFIIPVIALETVSSASGYNKNGNAIQTNPRARSRGQCSVAIRLRALGMSKSAAAPNAVLPSGITEESKWRIAILINKKDEPHVRAIPIESSQSSEVNDAWVSAVLVDFMTGTSLASIASGMKYLGVAPK